MVNDKTHFYILHRKLTKWSILNLSSSRGDTDPLTLIGSISAKWQIGYWRGKKRTKLI